METIDAIDADSNLDTLLDRVERGEAVAITRHGKPVALLVPATLTSEEARAMVAAASLRALAEELEPGGPTTAADVVGWRDTDRR